MHGFDMVKRSPAERARHHARAGAKEEPTTTTRPVVTTTVVVHPSTTAKTVAKTTVTPVTSTKAATATPIVSLPGVLPTVLTTSTTPTTSITSTSTSTPSTTSTSSSSSVVSTPRVLPTSSVTSSSTSALSTPSDAANAASTTTPKSGGLSGAATGGIIAACVLAAAALLIFAIRKTFIQRRKRKRNTWGAGMYPSYTDKSETLDLPPPLPEKVSTPMTTSSFAVGAPPSRTPVWAAPRPDSIVRSPLGTAMANVGGGYQPLSPQMRMQQQPQQNAYFVTPPPMSYNNPVDETYSAFKPTMTPNAPVQATAPTVEMAMVRVVYIPSLPDELSVSVGETVRVIKAFDDGWALCSNVRGEQGVVPLECLDRSASSGSQMQMNSGSSVGHGQEGDWRNMKRISSLSTQQQPHY